MIRGRKRQNLAELYEADETGWLELMSAMAGEHATAAMDFDNLCEYLADMAKRDKREAVHRLVVLLVHLLKWQHQPKKRSRSWQLTIQEQREELQELLESGTLRNYAEEALSKAYQKAVRRTAVDSKLPEKTFAKDCPFTLAQILGN